MYLKFSRYLDTSIRKQIKFTECVYPKQLPRKVLFLNMCSLCRYARLLQAQSHMYINIHTSISITELQEHLKKDTYRQGTYDKVTLQICSVCSCKLRCLA